MLPAASRLRRSREFALALREGRRARQRLVSVTMLPGDAAGPARVGFVVSRSVGGSVVRSRVARRLRGVLRERRGVLPAGALLVVRAQPGAAAATSADLGRDVDAALARLVGGAAAPPVGVREPARR